MRRILSGIVCLSIFAVGRAEVEAVEQPDAKPETAQQPDQVLTRQQQAKQEPGERKDGYIKAEVKGVLKYEDVFFPSFTNSGWQAAKCWTITVEDTKWVLNFGDNKTLLELAKTNEGKTVVVTGTVGTRIFFRPPALNTFKYEPPVPTPPGLSVTTLKAVAK